MTTADDGPVTRPVERQDLNALLGILVILEGELLAQEVSAHLAGRLADRLVQAGLLASSEGTGTDLPQAITNLGHRLRYALGEYAEPPPDWTYPSTAE